MTLLEKYGVLADNYGLDLILMQNDLTHEEVLRCLHLAGLIDVDDYWFEEMDLEGEED